MTEHGDCFPTAIRTAAELTSLGHPNVLVVHGLPIGSGGPIEGKRHWHAWAETLVPDSARGNKPTWAVADWSNGKPQVFIARTLFYKLGKVPQHLVWRYTPDEVVDRMDEYGHTGPWMDRARADALDETDGAGWVHPQPVENPGDGARC